MTLLFIVEKGLNNFQVCGIIIVHYFVETEK